MRPLGCPLEGREEQVAVRRPAGAGHLLGDLLGHALDPGRLEVAAPHRHDAAHVQGGDRLGQGTRGAGQLHVLGARRVPGLEVPQGEGGVGDERAVVQPFVDGGVVVQERGQRPAQRRGSIDGGVEEQRGEAVEEQCARLGSGRGGQGGPGGRRDRPQLAARLGQRAGDQGGTPGVEVGLARQHGVEPLEATGGPEQEQRRLAARDGSPVDLGAELFDPGALQVVDRIGLGLGQHPEPDVEGPGVQVRVRRGQGAVGAAGRLLGQRHRALQERRRTSRPGAGLGALGGAFELRSHGLVGPGGRGSQVPHPPVRVGLGIDRLGQGAVRGPALLGRARGVGGRSHQRVPEPHAGADLEQLLGPEPARPCRGRGRRSARLATAASGHRWRQRPQSAAAAGWARAARAPGSGSAPRALRWTARPPGVRTRRRAPRRSCRGPARGVPVGCPVSPRRAVRGPVRRAVPGWRRSAAPWRPPGRGPRRRAPVRRGTGGPLPPRGPPVPAGPTRPPAAARPRRAPGRTARPATVRRRPARRAAVWLPRPQER